MRWLFILLLLVNLSILGWSLQRLPGAPTDRSVIRPDVGNLRLLTERDQARPDTPEAMAAAPVLVDGVDESVAGIASKPEAVDLPVEERGTDRSAMPNREAQQASANEVAEAPPETDAPESRVQLAEAPSSDESRPVVPVVPEPLVIMCGAFGPFERGAEARALADSLASQGMDTSLRRESMEKPIGFWVMIPPLPNQEAAIEKVKQLRASGIEDIRRFVKGDQKNGISLGVFSNSKNARSRQQKIAEKGHIASVVPRMISVPSYWVDYRADQVRVESAVARLSTNSDTIKNEQYPCSRVVTSGGIF